MRLAFLVDDWSGHAPTGERQVRRKAAMAYGAPEVAEDEEAFLTLAERRRPFRTWAAVLVRAAG